MKEVNLSLSYKELESSIELPDELRELLTKAKEAINHSYAPYSRFHVGAAALLENGAIVQGSNQENASSPVGICAERVTMSAASAAHPNIPILAIAISAKAAYSDLSEPVAPCGLCRQTMVEYEERSGKPIQLVLQGETGKIIWIESAKNLLPLSFGMDDLNKK